MKPLTPFLMIVTFITFCAFVDRCTCVHDIDAMREEACGPGYYSHDLNILNPAWKPGNDPETRLIMDRICHEKKYVLEVSDPIEWE